MNQNVDNVIFVGRFFLIVAAIVTTLFPIVYAIIAPWEKSLLGRMMMLKAISVMGLVYLKLILTFFLKPSTRFPLMILNVSVLVLLTTSTLMLTYLIFRFQHEGRMRRKGILPVVSTTTSKPLINDRAYDLLKGVTAVVLPGVATLVLALGQIWNWDNTQPVAQTIVAVNAFLGVLQLVASGQYKKTDAFAPVVGDIVKSVTPEGKSLYSLNFPEDPTKALDENATVKFNIPK